VVGVDAHFFRLGVILTALAASAQAQSPALEHFEKKIRPVLVSRCSACHNSALASPQAGLTLDTAEGLRRVIRPGDPDNSLLIRAIRYTDKQLRMPPGSRLPADVVADFEMWVREGAALPADAPAAAKKKVVLWSLQKPQVVPGHEDIDSFIREKLAAKGLALSPEADKRTLIRRVTFDLVGLPPTAEEIDAFVGDDSPTAYARLVDRLLASQHYGERWGRHWLDVARYADSVNDSVNAGQRYPWSYTYRDWVIRAFNEDLPYDKFLLYQLAADRVKSIEPRHLAALGFLSLGREFPKSYPETVDDRIDAVARGMLGMTVACARCHDHKFDPIPSADYYSLYSILSNIRQPKELPLLAKPGPLTPKQQLYDERLKNIEEALREYRVRRNAEQVAFFKTQTADYLLAVHDSEGLSNPAVEELVRDRQLNLYMLNRWRKFLAESKSSGEPVFRAWHAAAGRSTASLKELAASYASKLAQHDRAEPFADPEEERWRAVMRGPQSPVDVPVEEFELIFTEGDSNNTRSIHVRYGAMLAQAAYDGAAPRAMAVEDVPDAKPVHVFLRGNPNNPGPLAPPHFLSCLGGGEFSEDSARLDLARSIADPGNPLTARVMVNRLWMHHFGWGLVRTPSDFGMRGEPPTHPELLDFLAVRFMQSGWSIKNLHRMIVMSATYRQSSADNDAGRKADPENQLLWRMNRQRLDIECLRDSMLAVAGRLDLTVGGLPFSLTALPSVPRRSVYGFIERGRVPGLLSAFDFASPDQHVPMRFTTTVPQQALFFLNSPFVTEQSRAIAARLSGSDAAGRVGQIFRWIFGRDPEPSELNLGLKFVAQSDQATAAVSAPSPWQYGIGGNGSFTPFPTFVDERWQGGSVLPAGNFGKAVLRPAGGEPGERPEQAVVLRWMSPVAGTLGIEGTLRHGQGAVPYGDGVHGRIVSSRDGELASWTVNGSIAETKLSGLHVEKGDTIDFIVDGRRDPENDGFSWSPTIKIGAQSWNSKNDFAGPAPAPLDVWARYTQVLLSTNEFAFVD
jgi:hypothetical protein